MIVTKKKISLRFVYHTCANIQWKMYTEPECNSKWLIEWLQIFIFCWKIYHFYYLLSFFILNEFTIQWFHDNTDTGHNDYNLLLFYTETDLLNNWIEWLWCGLFMVVMKLINYNNTKVKMIILLQFFLQKKNINIINRGARFSALLFIRKSFICLIVWKSYRDLLSLKTLSRVEQIIVSCCMTSFILFVQTEILKEFGVVILTINI